MPPDPLDLECFACQIVYFAHNYHAHSNIIVPPFSESWICPFLWTVCINIQHYLAHQLVQDYIMEIYYGKLMN